MFICINLVKMNKMFKKGDIVVLKSDAEINQDIGTPFYDIEFGKTYKVIEGEPLMSDLSPRSIIIINVKGKEETFLSKRFNIVTREEKLKRILNYYGTLKKT